MERRAIPGFSRYVVQDDGRIFRTCGGHGTYAGREIKGTIATGYRQYSLVSDEGEETLVLGHRIVLLTFVGPSPHGKPYSAHRDGDRANNRLSNLRWASSEENEADKIAHGRHIHGERHHRAKLTSAQVADIRQMLAVLPPRSGTRIAQEFGVSPRCAGKR